MTDYFALLDEPRAVWLDVAALKSRFHERSATVHPDRFHHATPGEKADANTRYAELNAAHSCLANTKSRLKHFLELETGDPPADIQHTPADLMDLFFECGTLCTGIDKFLREKDAVDSPLLKVQFFERGMDWSDKIQEFNGRLTICIGELETELQAGQPPLPRIEEIYRRLSYYERWHSQLQERFAKLSF
jgi:hypothetical protein